MGTPGAESSIEYPCLNCQAILEDATGGASPWLRCPRCGRAGRPPSRAALFVPTVEPARDDIIFLDTEIEPAPPGATPKVLWPYTPAKPSDQPASAWRAVSAAALFVSVILLLFAVLEGSAYGVTAFTGAAIVSFGFLIRSARS